MAAGDTVLFTHYEYAPDVGGFVEPGLPSDQAVSLLELSGGRLALAGGAIRDTGTNRFIGSISRQAGASLDVGTDGTILLNNNVAKARLRDAMGTGAIPRAIVTGDLTVFGSAFPSDVSRTITLAPQGQVIYVDESKLPGRAAYSRVNMDVFGDAGPPLKNSLGTLITADQMLIRGVAGWLANNASSAIDRLKLQGVDMPDGTTSVSGSDIVRAIAANVSVRPVVTYVLSEGNLAVSGAA